MDGHLAKRFVVLLGVSQTSAIAWNRNFESLFMKNLMAGRDEGDAILERRACEFSRPFGTYRLHASNPNDKSLRYCRMSLRDLTYACGNFWIHIVEGARKPLRRLTRTSVAAHRAKAPVLMRLFRGTWVICGLAGSVSVAMLLGGCKGVPTDGERAARQDLDTVRSAFGADSYPKSLPVLNTNSPLSDFLQYSMLNQPSIAAAYYDWAASVERITIERSLPDPKLTFQAYITDTLTSLMPGLMQEFPWPGKLGAAGDASAAEAKSKYYAFENAALAAAFSVKQSYYQLWFLEDKIRINRETLGLLGDIEKSARARNEVGKATLQDVYRAQIEEDRLTTEIANLEDSRRPMQAQFKGALGLGREQADPPLPANFEATPISLDGDELLDGAFARNPRLKAMEADVRMAEASIALARKSKLPDFSVGLQAEVYTPPFYWPYGSVTLPIWKEKIAAQIAAAQAKKDSATARLSSEQIALTVDFAAKTYDYREMTRNVALMQDKLIPKAHQSLEIARAGYLTGQIDFFNLLDAERTLLGFELEQVQARTRREIILADLALTVAGIAPDRAPFLSTSSK